MAGLGRLVSRTGDCFDIAGLVPGTVERITELHATYYIQHHGFHPGFKDVIREGMNEFAERFDGERDGAWTLIDGGRVEGGVFIDARDAENQGCRLRWFIVSEHLQGRGAGRTLLDRALGHCREKQYPRVHLWTVDTLAPARALYRRAGFARVLSRPSTQFGPKLQEEKYELVFRHPGNAT